jgi:hypothetical protein
MQSTSITSGEHHYAEWKKDLGFYQDELKVFTNRLTEVAAKNTGRETMQMVEHFQNQFIIQSENIDILLHDLKLHVSAVAQDVQEHAGHVSRDRLAMDGVLKDRVDAETHVFGELKTEFMQFLSKVM